MKSKTSLLRTGLASVLCALAAAGAHAVPAYSPVYSTSSLAGYTPMLFSSYVTTGNAGTVSGSIVNVYASPVGVPNGGSYVYASPTDGKITVNDINASSFSFLWGSPDAENKVTYHTSLGDFLYTGKQLTEDFGITSIGDTSISTVFTASLGSFGRIQSVDFTSTKIAFEVDGVSKVPEPGSIALVATAMGALAWTGRRRKA